MNFCRSEDAVLVELATNKENVASGAKEASYRRSLAAITVVLYA